MVTKSCIAQFVEGDAFNPSALSDYSTGPSPVLAHAKSTLSPFQASAGCPRAGLFASFARSANKRLIAVGKFERNVKDHLSMFLKLRFHVLQRSRNDTFLRAFVNTLSSFWPSSGGSMSETVLLMRPCWCLTGQVGPPPPPLRGRPHRLTAGRGAVEPPPALTVSGNVSYCRGPVRGKKQQTFYPCCSNSARTG